MSKLSFWIDLNGNRAQDPNAEAGSVNIREMLCGFDKGISVSCCPEEGMGRAFVEVNGVSLEKRPAIEATLFGLPWVLDDSLTRSNF